MEKGYVLSFAQLKMLASSQGFDGVVGLPECSAAINSEELPLLVNGLLGAGLVEATGNAFACSPAAAEIGRRIGGADSYIIFRSNKSSLPDFCCYPGEELMLCTPSVVQKDRSSVRFADFDELTSLLTDEGYCPNQSEILELNEQELEAFEKRSCDPESSVPLLADGSIAFSAERVSVDDEAARYVRIVSFYFYRYILECRFGEKIRKRYSLTELKNALKGLIS